VSAESKRAWRQAHPEEARRQSQQTVRKWRQIHPLEDELAHLESNAKRRGNR